MFGETSVGVALMFAVTVASGTLGEAVEVAVGLEVGFKTGVDFGVVVNSYQTADVNKTAIITIAVATVVFISAWQLR